MPRVLILFGVIAGALVLRDHAPPDFAIVAPAAYDGVLMEEATIEKQAKEAGLILYGTVTDVTPRRNGKAFVTDVKLDVDGTLRGTAGSTFSFTLQGGSIGDSGLAVGGVPNFLEGERVLLFFDSASNKNLLRLWQGKITLAGNEALQVEAKKRMSVATLETTLRNTLKKDVTLPKDGPSASSQPFVTSDPCPPWDLSDLPVIFDVNPASPGTGGPTGTNFARLAYDSWHAWQALDDSYPAFAFGTITTRGQSVDGLDTVGWGNLGSGILGVNHCAWIGDERYDSDTLIDRDSFTWDADDTNGISSSAYSLQAVLEHELGHGLSLGHSNMTCNGSASTPLMCPAVSNGVRKTILADDRAGAAFMYGLTGSAPGAPSNLGVLTGDGVNNLSWTASSGTKHAYDIERSSNGCTGTFKSINTVAGNVTTFADNNYGDGIGTGNWCYRVKALGTGGDSGWSNTAAPTVEGDPYTVSVTPNNSTATTGSTVTLVSVFGNTAGASELRRVETIMPADNGNWQNGCWLVYMRDVNRLYLVDHDGTWLNAGIPGSGSTVQNTRCSLNGAATTVTTNGNQMTVSFRVTVKQGFEGTKIIRLRSQEVDTFDYSSTDIRGALTVISATGVRTMGTNPYNGVVDVGQNIALVSAFGTTTPANPLRRMEIAIPGPAGSWLTGCWAVYMPGVNRLYLIGDDNTWLNAGAPGSASFAEDDQCRLSATGSSVSVSGNTTTVTFNLRFKNGFQGPHNIRMRAQEDNTFTYSMTTTNGSVVIE